MKKIIFLYTENYVKGGGNRYFTDIVNVIPSEYELILASNAGGLYNHDLARINRLYTYVSVDIRHAHTEKINNDSIVARIKYYIKKSFNLIMDKVYNRNLFNQLLSEYNPQIVISANGGYPAALSCLQLIEVAYLKKILTILTVVSMPQPLWSGGYLLERIFYSSVLKKMNLMIVNSQIIKKEFINTYKVLPDKINIIHNCIDNIYIKRELITNQLTIGYVGRLEVMKGIFFLIDAFNLLIKDTKNIKLLLVGDGNIQKIEDKINEYNINEYVTITGFYEGNIADVLKEIDIFVFPSLWEGFPYSILEAMSSGKVIVSTNVGGISEAIEDGVNGFLVPPADSGQLYDVMKKIFLNFKNYLPIGENARMTIEKRFSPNVFKQNFVSLLESITNQYEIFYHHTYI